MHTNREFVHLHVHTDYSIGDSTCSIYQRNSEKSDLVKMAQKFSMPAMAITDHNNMGGAIEFYLNMNNNALKPLIGCEINIVSSLDKSAGGENQRLFHLVLLAKDFVGYQNLCKLVSAANLSEKSGISKEGLSKHSKGLIGLSGCVQGEIPYLALNNEQRWAKSSLNDYIDIFGKENFYLELMNHRLSEQTTINSRLINIAKEFSVHYVATNNVHYLEKEHAKIREIYVSINNGTKFNNKIKLPTEELYFKSSDEMYELFKEVPESISNTLAVAEKCNLCIPFVPDANHYPVYEIKTGLSEKEYLRNICLGNMMDRYGFDPQKTHKYNLKQQEIIDRLNCEIDVINNSKYCGYFLIVRDLIKYAHSKQIPVGPGRGSGAGSIVAYLTHITDVDPIKYQLLFERFMNSESISPPDFDIDVCQNRRSEIIEYVRNKYGSNCVTNIGTYGKFRSKAVVKEVGRRLGASSSTISQITKLIPYCHMTTLTSLKENNNDLNKLLNDEGWASDIFKYSEFLEGLNRNMCIHAAGLLIGDESIDKFIPLIKMNEFSLESYFDGDEGKATQYTAYECELLGLLKIDFLGLNTLSIIQDTVDRVERIRGEKIDVSKISLTDKKTYKLFSRGDTAGVFQFESGGMRKLCRKFRVDSIEDIIALIALYRPGPIQFIGDFINRKTGKVKVEYNHPKMEPVLKCTYGIILYQEQVMQLAQALAGFSLGGADILRRAIGKKEIVSLTTQKKRFIEGCAKHSSIEESKANTICDKIEMFAGYAFNKSHAAAYATIAYRTAYLKANYADEFIAAVQMSKRLSTEKPN